MVDVISTPPDELTPAAKEKWVELAAILAARRAVNEFDLDMLRQYCEAWQLRADAVRLLVAENGLLDRGPNGARYPKPYFKVIEQAERTMDRVFRRLSITATRDDEPNEFDKF